MSRAQPGDLVVDVCARDGDMVLFWCVACDEPHSFRVDGPRVPNRGPWSWNRSVSDPTFAPSLKVETSRGLCHLHVRSGRLRYVGDCWHVLAGTVVDMVPWKEVATDD